MLYQWDGIHPHRRYHNVMAPAGRGKSKVARVDVMEIRRGDVFEPTDAELHSFKDLMRPVGAGLQVAENARVIETPKTHEFVEESDTEE